MKKFLSVQLTWDWAQLGGKSELQFNIEWQIHCLSLWSGSLDEISKGKLRTKKSGLDECQINDARIVDHMLVLDQLRDP